MYELGDSDDGAIMDSDEDGLDTSDLGENYISHTFSSSHLPYWFIAKVLLIQIYTYC